MSTFFGARLKKAREDAGLTQQQLADKLGVSQSTINTAEKKGNSFRKTELAAKILGVSSFWLSTGQGTRTLTDDSTVPKSTTDTASWPFESVDFARWQALTERQKGAVEMLINDALDKIQWNKGTTDDR
jgi:transcriptional regulator with XRE-family HTH domain